MHNSQQHFKEVSKEGLTFITQIGYEQKGLINAILSSA